MKKETQVEKTAEKEGEGGEPSRCRSASMRAESEKKRRKKREKRVRKRTMEFADHNGRQS